jgi:class 3 adenylate cyclase
VERSGELRDIVLGIYHDWSRGDPSFLDRCFSLDDGAVEIGTDAEEFYVGGLQAREVWRKQILETNGARITPGDLWAYSEGSVGWVIDNPIFAWGPEPYPVRFTWLFHKEGSAWKVVHLHASIGYPNLEVVGFEITTSIDAVADIVDRERPSLAAYTSPEGTVTIMFTDMESSTALNERLGDDVFVPLLLKLHDIVGSRTAAAAGSIVKSEGDGFMLVFPSARRAVDCAVAIQRDLLSIDDRLKLRMGLHTGEPARHADDFFGRDVAYAARIGAAASGGEVLVSSLVKSLVGPSQSTTFDGPRDLELKGFDGPQPVFEVVWH